MRHDAIKTPILVNQHYAFSCTAEALALAPVYLKNYCYDLLTIGLHRFWGAAENRQYFSQQTAFLGRSFRYDGNGREAFMAVLPHLVAVFFLVLVAVPSWFLLKQSRLHTVLSALALAAPLVVHGFYTLRRYRLSHTYWGRDAFAYRVPLRPYLLEALSGVLLTVASLGLYLPFCQHRLRRLNLEGTCVGPLAVKYTGTFATLFLEYFWALPLTFATGGLYLPWFMARMQRYKYANIWIGSPAIGYARGFFKASGSEYFLLLFYAIALSVVTLGFAMPWVKVQWQRFHLEHLAFVGNLVLTPAAPPVFIDQHVAVS